MDQPTSNSPNKIDFSGLRPPEPMGEASPTNMPNSRGGPALEPKSLSMPGAISPNTPNPPNSPKPSSPIDPLEQDEKGHLASYLLMGFLVIILILGILIFISWKGWISLGGVEKLWGGGKNTPPATLTQSPTINPSIETSPETPEATGAVTTNINDQTRKSDLAKIKNGLIKYYDVNGAYPISSTVIKTSEPGTILATALIPVYLDSLPLDPNAPTNYYGYKSDGTSFELTCILEDKSDPAGASVGQYFIYKITNLSTE